MADFTDDNGIYYNILDGGTTVEVGNNTSFSGTSVSILSPVSHLGTSYTVVRIGDSAFEHCTSLQSVDFPDSLTSIGNYAFNNCSNLTSVDFPDSSSLTSIGPFAFYNCTSLASVTFPASLTTIGFDGFSSCSGLTSVTFPASLTTIGPYAFRYCWNLTSVDLSNCTSLTTICGGTFRYCWNLTSVTFPNSLTTIDHYYAFSECNLTSVTFPASLTSIGDNAFYNCNGLTSVTFNGLTIPTLGTDSFSNIASPSTVYYQSGTTNLPYLQSRNFFTNYVEVNTSLTELKVAGYDLLDPANPITNINLHYGNTNAPVQVITSDPEASFIILGNTNLSPGTSTVTVRVTSSNGIVNQDYNVNIFIPEVLSSDAVHTAISSLQINGTDALPDDTIYVAPGTTSASINLVPSESGATHTYSGHENLVLGPNPFNAKVTSADGLQTTSYDYTIFVQADAPCFLEGTKILTMYGFKQIENLKIGDLVKTLKNGFQPIRIIGKSPIYHENSEERMKDQLYTYTSNVFPELIEDLVITGCHCVLVDDFKDNFEREKTNQVNQGIYITDNKYRLPACADERSKVYPYKGNYTVYHIALENSDYLKNYGIFANGLLVESCSLWSLKEKSKMELIY